MSIYLTSTEVITYTLVWLEIEGRSRVSRYSLSYDEKKIAASIVRLEDKHYHNKTDLTAWEKGVVKAIAKANEDIDLSEELLAKVRVCIIDHIPFELLGETYCSRNTFYSYRNKYLYYVAKAYGIREDGKPKRKKHHG